MPQVYSLTKYQFFRLFQLIKTSKGSYHGRNYNKVDAESNK